MDLISTPLKADHKFPREDFLEMLNEIHRWEKMNSIFITLIQKGDNQDFRFISLVGVHLQTNGKYSCSQESGDNALYHWPITWSLR